MADATKNPFGLVGDVKNALSELATKISTARHLVNCTREALESGKIGNGPDEIDPHRLANNLKDALDALDEVSV